MKNAVIFSRLALGAVWFYEGLVPKLLFVRPDQVELVRRSDLVEVFPALRRFGIPRSWLKQELWQAVPRAGFWPSTLEITRTHWRRMLPGMFRPPVPGQSDT